MFPSLPLPSRLLRQLAHCPSEWILARNGTYHLWPHPMGFPAKRAWKVVEWPWAGSFHVALAWKPSRDAACANVEGRGQARQTQASGVLGAMGLPLCLCCQPEDRTATRTGYLCADIAGTLSLLMRVLHLLPFVHKASPNSSKVLGEENPDVST